MTVRSGTNFYEMQDVTSDLLRLPTTQYTISSLGLFQDEFSSTHSVQFEEQFINGKLVVDTLRGTRGQTVQDRNRKTHVFSIPHFEQFTAVYPRDVQGVRGYGTLALEDSIAAAELRKMEDIERNWSWTQEVAKAKLITSGDIYAPSGTVVHNWRTEFGLGAYTPINFALSTAGTKVLLKNELALQGVRNGLQNGGRVTGIVYLCSTSFFNAYVTHNSVEAAYANWTNAQDPIRSRVGTPVNSLNRTFQWGGIILQEVSDLAPDGTPLIPDGEAYAVPMGTDIFKMFYGPREAFSALNKAAERMYMLRSGDDTKVEIYTESNFAAACMSPNAIQKLVIS